MPPVIASVVGHTGGLLVVPTLRLAPVVSPPTVGRAAPPPPA